MADKDEWKDGTEPAAFGGMTHRLKYDAKQRKQNRSHQLRIGWIAIAVAMLCSLALLLWLGING